MTRPLAGKNRFQIWIQQAKLHMKNILDLQEEKVVENLKVVIKISYIRLPQNALTHLTIKCYSIYIFKLLSKNY